MKDLTAETKLYSGMARLYYRQAVRLLIMILAVLLISALYLTIGEINIPFKELPAVLQNKNGIEYSVLKNLRIPRLVLAIAVGGSLSLAGSVLQGIYRNPLVEPYTLGISGGAALGVALVIVLGSAFVKTAIALPLGGFLGALLSLLLVYFLSIRKNSININRMLLIGVMVSFIASASMMFIMATTTSENMHSIVFWIMGSLDEPEINLINITLIVSLSGLILSMLFARPLNALRLGATEAQYLGINTNASIRVLFLIASVLTGVCVSVAGVIGFVGLIIPHIIRFILSSDYRFLLPGSFLGGSFFLIGCDIIARTVISPNELPIGVITGILGGVIFIGILSGSKRNRVLTKQL